ncbi:sensor histidine kinase [Rhodoligotrophos defluvii]|uniref:sensor histidine kinase n=1 Tax=Rhodoligotrophos defluvii TaxID=2561934 RepID=UPI0010C9EAF5|nr:sensor histidine kinase [Rhodoligotrophos defluvii]
MATSGEGSDAEILLAEMRHRLANTFQMLAGFVLQQMRAAQHEEARARLKAVHSVVTLAVTLQRSMAAVSGETFGLHLLEMTKAWDTLGARQGISVTLEIENGLAIPDKAAMILALVIHELVSNAIEHAFPGRGEGQVRIGLSTTADGQGCLCVRDDGIGIDPDRWPALMPSDRALTGLWLVESLVARLRGALVVARANPAGTLAKVRFPL